jgi:L-threonylcarbamoyladenylate synthase
MAIIEPFHLADVARTGRAVTNVLAAGGVVAIPTESYYGLAVNPFDAGAIDRLYQIKGRPDGKPLLVLIGARAQLPRLAAGVPPSAELLMEAFWPGPLTIVFDAHPTLPPGLTAGTATVGVRLTGHALMRTMLTAVGPVTGTSANRSGAPPPQTAQEVEQIFGEEVALILDGGLTAGGPPSTVVDARDTVRVLREGSISRQMLVNVLQTRGIAVEPRGA